MSSNLDSAKLARIGRPVFPVLLVAIAALLASATRVAASGLHFEIAYPTGVNQFSSFNYICPDCTIEDYESLVLPTGYLIRNTRILVPETEGGIPAAAPDGVPVTLDLVAAIPGDDFLLCCEVLNGSFLGLDSGVLFSTVQVRRANTFTYAAGDVLHELTDPLGTPYALFLIDVVYAETHDPAELDALADLPLPAGWSYASRVLSEPLVLTADASGLTSNFGQVAIGAGVLASWQAYAVPEPGTLLLLASGLVALAARGGRMPG